MTLGRLEDDAAKGEAGAVATGAQSVDYADRSGDAFRRMGARTTHADALLQAGAWGEAARRFAEAEAMQRERQPSLPLLYSLQGYHRCDLKLAQGRADEVAARMSCMEEWSKRHGWQAFLLDDAIYELAAGRAAHAAVPSPSPHASLAWGGDRGEGRPNAPALASAAVPHPTFSPQPGRRSPPPATAGAQLDAAVAGLRAAGSSAHLPNGLLARAAYHRDAGNDKLATADLTEAFEIAERGGMRLFLADCWLERARQRLAEPNAREERLRHAAEAIVRAEKIVEEAGYHRRDPDLAIVRAELALMLGDVAGARTNLDTVIAAMRTHDLWSFLPEVVRLAERHGLADLAPTIADLTAQRARFDAEADAAFEQARKVRRSDGLDDDVIDARLADPAFRQSLAEILQANGHDLDKLALPVQRQAAREYIEKVERKGEKEPQPDGLDDDVIDARLADPAFRARLSALLVSNGYKPLDETPVEEQRNDARTYILEVERKREADAEPGGAPAKGDTDPASIPDAIVEEALGNADFHRLLDEMLLKSGSPKLEDLDADDRRAAARAMIAAMAQSDNGPASSPTSEAAPPRPRDPPPAPPRPAAAGPPVPSPPAPPPVPRRRGPRRRLPLGARNPNRVQRPVSRPPRSVETDILRRMFGSFMRRGT